MKKISLSKLESFLKARCDDLRAAGLDATEYRDYIIAMIFLKRVNDLFVQRKEAYVRELKKQFPDLTDEELALEAEENNSDVYEFYVPLLARWRVDALPVGEHRKFSQQRSEAKGKLEEERIRGEERERWQRQFDEAERMLNWQGLLTVKNDVGDALTIALHDIEDANGQVLSGVLSSTKFNEVNTKGEKKLPDGILVQLINDFNEITLTDDNFEFPDLLGAAYEYLLKYFADIAGKKGGEFYTPSAVVELMGKILQPAKDAEICDPTVGSGGLLINMRNYVESRYGSSRDLSLYGQELIDHTYKMCKMNMIFHGIRDARIEQGDTLLSPKLTKGGGLCKFDIVVANPPFSQNYTTTDMKFKERFRFWMPRKKKADLMFVQHMVATLKAEGRMAVVMPHGVLFRGGEEQRYREELINGQLGCILECVIGLPPELFYGTGIPASILVINRKGAKDRKGVFFINADREYHEGKNQNMLRPEDVEKISYVYTHKCVIPKYSRLVTRQELAEEDAWNPEEYEVLPKTELKRIKGEIKDAKGGRKEVEKEIKSLEKRVKACRKAKEDTAALEVEIAEKSAELKPFDERIAALTAQIERHEELAAELRECNADIRAIERRKDDLVATAREKISPQEAKELILARWYRTLASTISAYVEAHLRSVIASVENLHDKYTVTLGNLLSGRNDAAKRLDGFLAELGYGGTAELCIAQGGGK